MVAWSYIESSLSTTHMCEVPGVMQSGGSSPCNAHPLFLVGWLQMYAAERQKTWRNSDEVVTKRGLFHPRRLPPFISTAFMRCPDSWCMVSSAWACYKGHRRKPGRHRAAQERIRRDGAWRQAWNVPSSNPLV